MFATILIVLVAVIHAYFLVLEMFLWEGPRARRVFGLTPEFAAETRVLAANQGLYNGFLSAGLVFGLIWGSAGGTNGQLPAIMCCCCRHLWRDDRDKGRALCPNDPCQPCVNRAVFEYLRTHYD